MLGAPVFTASLIVSACWCPDPRSHCIKTGYEIWDLMTMGALDQS